MYTMSYVNAGPSESRGPRRAVPPVDSTRHGGVAWPQQGTRLGYGIVILIGAKYIDQRALIEAGFDRTTMESRDKQSLLFVIQYSFVISIFDKKNT